MVAGLARTSSPARGVFLALAFLALALKVLIPPGFMAAAPTNDLPFAIVLCSGQGPVSLAPGEGLSDHGGDTAPAEKGKDAPCAFAGLGAAALAPDGVAGLPTSMARYAAFLPAAVAHLAPGAGLPAPPPPARGPPSLLI